jgi:hypothetical protein
MNNVLSFVQPAGASSDSGPGLYSDHMLAELLALQEETIAQLRLERLMVAGTADFLADIIDHFLTGAIEQHEKAAAMLRAQFWNYPANRPGDDPVSRTGGDSSDAEKIFTARSA